MTSELAIIGFNPYCSIFTLKRFCSGLRIDFERFNGFEISLCVEPAYLNKILISWKR